MLCEHFDPESQLEVEKYLLPDAAIAKNSGPPLVLLTLLRMEYSHSFKPIFQQVVKVKNILTG